MKIVPRLKQVLVKPDGEESNTSELGLVTPSNIEKEKKAVGTVLAVGSEADKDIKKGDKIIYGAYVGETINTKEKGKEVEYKLLFAEDILAFIK